MMMMVMTRIDSGFCCVRKAAMSRRTHRTESFKSCSVANFYLLMIACNGPRAPRHIGLIAPLSLAFVHTKKQRVVRESGRIHMPPTCAEDTQPQVITSNIALPSYIASNDK